MRLVMIDKETALTIVETLEQLSNGACEHLNDLEFSIHTLFAVSALQPIFLQHESVTDKSPENLRQCFEDLKTAFTNFCDLHYTELLVEISRNKGS